MTLEEAILKLKQYFFTHKRLPSYQELAELYGYASKNASRYIVTKLIDEGVVEKDAAGKLVPGSNFFAIPLLGSIKAGYPDEAYQSFLNAISIDHYLVENPGQAYALKVTGDSMIEAGINNGDIVIIEKDKQPREGDIVVAEIDNEFTLKYFKRRAGKVYLLPANPNYPPLYPKANLSIFGVVISVIRKYH
jgi:SOS regulatory protein LexA